VKVKVGDRELHEKLPTAEPSRRAAVRNLDHPADASVLPKVCARNSIVISRWYWRSRKSFGRVMPQARWRTSSRAGPPIQVRRRSNIRRAALETPAEGSHGSS
jgi:hypothetical protein